MFNDLDLDFSENLQASQEYLKDKRNQRKIKEATDVLRGKLPLMNPLREGKKLLVLDIDYSERPSLSLRAVLKPVLQSAILDTKPLLEGSLPSVECARPRLHEFLEMIYPYYDICVWSAPFQPRFDFVFSLDS